MNPQRVIFKWLAIVIAITMLLQSAPMLPTASAQQTDSQVCEWTDGSPITWEEITCKQLPEVASTTGMNGQDGLSPETSNMLESLSSTPTVPWSNQVGGVGTEINDVEADASGNVYVTGTITSVSDSNAFVAKLNSSGNSQWSYSFGGMAYDEGHGIALDLSGNIFMTGSARNSSNPGTADILLARLSGDGSLQWKTTLGNPTQQDVGKDIAMDGTGNIYVTGGSFGSWGSPIQPYTSGQYDAFVAKFNPDSGNQVWNTFLGENLNGFGVGIAADFTGKVYVTGANFPGSTADAFVAGLNPNGSLLWYTTVGSASVNDAGRDIVLDGDGNVYLTGDSWGPWGSPLNGFSGPQDAFVIKLSNGGSLQWNTFVGGTGHDLGYGIGVDVAGNIYLSGYSTDTWGNPFVSGTGVPQEVFAAKLNNSGDLEWNTFIHGEAWYQSYGHKNRITEQNGLVYIVSNIDVFENANAFVTKIDTAYTPESVQIEITDAAGNPVSALSLNSDGWPTPNPLKVKVTLTCLNVGTNCNYPFNLAMGGVGLEQARFYVYDAVIPNPLICLGDHPNQQNSYNGFSISCSNPNLILNSGQSAEIDLSIWIQPSSATELEVIADWGASATQSLQIPQAAIHPVALIPGDGVSHQFISNNYYDSLLQTLEKMGYERDRTLFPWDYSPVGSFVDTAAELAGEIAQWQADAVDVPWVWLTPGNQNQTSFDMMAHSAGVMVTRAYVQLTSDANYTPVNKLLLVGGTNKGILSNYAAREGLYGDNPVFKILLGPVLTVKAYQCGHTSVVQGLDLVVTEKDKYLTLHDRNCGILSAPEQLPVPDSNDPAYLIDASNSNPYPYGPASLGSPKGYQYNTLLQGAPTDLRQDPWWMPNNTNPNTTYYNLNGRILADLAHRNIPVQDVHIFYSDNIQTNLTYKVTNPASATPLWRNGIWSTENADAIRDIVGDGAVPLYSARAADLWPGSTPHRLVWLESGTDSRPEKHGNLMVYPESQQEIGLTLSDIKPPFSTPMNAINELFQNREETRVINGFGLSPIELLVIDPQGRKLGYDPASGQILKEIPLGIYVHPTGKPVEFAIYEPVTGNYTITVTGTGNGSYTLLDVFTDDHASVPILFEQNTIQQGQIYTTTMNVPAISGDVPYPPDVNAGVDVSTVAGTPVQFNGIIKDINPNDTFNIQWDFGDGSTASAVLTPSHAYSVPGTYTATLIVTDSTGFTISDTLIVTITPAPPPQFLYLSLNNAATLSGLSAQDIDILSFNGSTWSMFFDGSDVGINTSSQDLNEFHILDSDTILMSFDEPITLGTLSADPWDVVRFDATSLGDNTAGNFSMYLDGNDVGLDTTNEYIDGLDVLPDGRVLLSTTGTPTVSGVSGAVDEDILAFTPTALGDITSGTWSLYFDGSDVGLADNGDEDVDALAVYSNGDIYLSTLGNFAVTGVSGADEDVFVCTPTSLGNTTACNYSTSLYFDGSAYGLDANDVDGVDVALP